MKKSALTFVILFCLAAQLMAQQKDFDKVATSLANYMSLSPQEKIHIHFDRSSYSIGDTIWFKVYLVNPIGNRLSGISKVVHIDIKSPSGTVKQMVLPVSVGMASAQLALTDSLYQAGNYTLRAYTKLMRNAGEDYFFNHTFRVAGPATAPVASIAPEKATNKKNVVPVPPQQKEKLYLDFFPEGGSLVSGIRSKVGFKAVDKNGLGTKVKGHIENSSGERVAMFESGHAGMGILALLPQVGTDYRAVIDEGKYEGQRFDLTKALNNGYVLSVSQAANGLQVRISRSGGMEADTEVRLMVQSNGEVQQALKLPMSTSTITFTVPKAELAEGINQLTLFSTDNRPLAERLVFVRKEQQGKSLLESDKQEYGTRDKVKLSLSITDEKGAGIIGGYSVSVAKADVALPEENQLSIYSNLLLSSDLRGNIESPNYYFTGPTAQKDAELDALLLTQGWRRFNWTEVMSEKQQQPKYSAEEGLRLSGRITTLGGKPIAGAKINFLVTKEMLILDTVADAQGRFAFKDLQLGDTATIILRAKGLKDNNNAKITLDIDSAGMMDFKTAELTVPIDTTTSSSSIEKAADPTQPQPPGKIVQGTTLKTVNITTKRRPEIKGSLYPFAAPPPDYTLEPDKLQEINDLQFYLKNRFSGVVANGDKLYGYYHGKIGPMVILLNGNMIEDVSGINPKALTGVQIVKGGVQALNMATGLLIETPNAYDQNPGFGIVLLTMAGVDKKYIKPNRPPGFLQYEMTGYTYAREFYAPQYDKQKELPKTDFRNILFWKSDIITGENGKAEINFYTSDETGNYQITLEGIGANGELCRKVNYFVVK